MKGYSSWMVCVFLFVFCLSMLGVQNVVEAEAHPDAVVDGSYTGADGAVTNGSKVKVYNTIQSALNEAPIQVKPYVIFIKNGRYYEKLNINKPYITFIGENIEKTKLTYDNASDTKKPDGKPYGTSGATSLTIAASNFTAENMTIENGFDYPGNFAKDDKDATKLKNVQAVALKTDTGSDKAIFKNCRILAYQDTLYANAGRQYYSKCYISGNVDFIFGAGQAVFEDCDIVSRSVVYGEQNGYVTAASTQLAKEYGFLFINCRLKKEDAKMSDGGVTLGRPWHPTINMPDGTRQADPNAVGAVVFKNCYLDTHIAARGWDPMSGRDKDGKVIWFSPQNPQHARFYEYGSTGPGAGEANETRTILSRAEAEKYTISNVLEGWDPKRN